MGKFNFKNYDRKNRNYGNNDLNIDRLSREFSFQRMVTEED